MSDAMLMGLMDLATLDTSDMKAQMSRLQTPGIYIADLNEIGIAEQPNSDPALPSNFLITTKSTTLAFRPLEAGVMTEEQIKDMEGKPINERYFIDGTKIREAIQLLMGRFKTAGLRHKGLLGGVEGAPAGWLDEAVGKRIAIRVRQYVGKDGQDRVSFDWLSPKQMEKLELPWEILGRDYCDENGNPVDLAA